MISEPDKSTKSGFGIIGYETNTPLREIFSRLMLIIPAMIIPKNSGCNAFDSHFCLRIATNIGIILLYPKFLQKFLEIFHKEEYLT